MRSSIVNNLFNSMVSNSFNSGKLNIGKPDEKKLICLNCDLPASECKSRHCKRYTEELNKLKEKSNA